MTIETRKISFIQEFLKLQNEEIISDLETVLRKSRIELLGNELQPMSMEQFNADIDQSLADIKNGCITEVNDFKNKVNNW